MSRRRRVVRIVGLAAAGLVGLIALAVLGAATVLQGERLARLISGALPPMAGKIELRAVRWSPGLLLALATDAPTPISVDGLRITGPDGKVVLRAERLDVQVRPRSAARGKIILSDLRISGGPSLWRFNGFIDSFAPRRKPGAPLPPPPPPAKDAQPFYFQIVDAHLDGMTAVFDFPAWGLELRDIKSPATLLVEGDFVGWDVQGLDARAGGFLRVLTEVLPFDRVQVARVATTRDWPDDIFLDVAAATTGRSTLRARGSFTEIYGYGYKREPQPGIKMHGEFDDAADALAAVARGHAIPGLRLGGAGARMSIDLHDPFARLQIETRLQGLDVGFLAYEARKLVLQAHVGTEKPDIRVDELSFQAPGGGRFALGAEMVGDRARARLRFERFTTNSYVPPGLRRLAAGKLDGRLTIAAELGKNKRVAVSGLDLALTRARAGGLPRTLRVRGDASASPERVATAGLTIDVPGATAHVRGEAQLARQLISLGLRASTTDLPRLLESLGMQPLARGAAVSLEVGGTMQRPDARGEVVVNGISVKELPEVPELRARFRLQDGTLQVDQLSAAVFGGALSGGGALRLFQGTTARMLRTPVLAFKVEGRDLELSTLGMLAGVAAGRLSFVATAEGPLDKLHAHLELPPGATLELLGLPWELGGIDADYDVGTRQVVVRTARLTRKGGAQIEVTGHMGFAGSREMDWQVTVRDVALEGLPGLATSGVPVSGRVSATLRATGPLARPRLAGTVALAGIKARGIELGDGQLVLSPVGDSGIAVHGNLFHRFDVQAQASFAPGGPSASGSVSFDKLALEELLPEVIGLGDGKGVASGRVSVEWSADRPLAIEAALTELSLSVVRDTVDKQGKAATQRIWVRNAGPLRAAVSGDHVTLDEARLVTDGGEFRVKGQMQGDGVGGQLSGHLDLDLLQPLVRKQLAKLTGDLAVELKVGGTLKRPALDGSVVIANPVHLQAVGFDPEVVVPSGTIKLGSDFVELSDLAVTVDRATMKLRGRAGFDASFQPTTLDVAVGGEVSARLLEQLAPDTVSDASGRARIQAQLTGTPKAPVIAARVDLGEIALRLRDLGRQITVESGTVELNNKELVLRDVKTRLDDQGHLLIGSGGMRPGRVQIKSLTPKLEIGNVDIPLRGDRLTYRVPGSIEIDDLTVDRLQLTGNLDDGLQLSGEVLINFGRYVGDFTVGQMVISRRVREGSLRSMYDQNPLLADMGLDLRVRTVGDSFMVQNNLAPEIDMVVDLRVSGTAAEPRIDGEIRPTGGRFHIIGMRGDFELSANVNHVVFVGTKSIANGETPELNLEAQNPVTDSSGNEHNVRMSIRGPINQANLDLSSDDGLDRNQTLLLLVSGRTSDDIARIGTTSNPTLGSNVRSATDMVGQLSRDTVANLVEPYIDDALQLVTGRKVNLRPTVGADGFELKLLARASRQLDLQLSFLRGFQNQQRYRGEVGVWVMDYLTLRGFGERLILTPQQGLNEEISSLNLELTLDFPIRLWRP